MLVHATAPRQCFAPNMTILDLILLEFSANRVPLLAPVLSILNLGVNTVGDGQLDWDLNSLLGARRNAGVTSHLLSDHQKEPLPKF